MDRVRDKVVLWLRVEVEAKAVRVRDEVMDCVRVEVRNRGSVQSYWIGLGLRYV